MNTTPENTPQQQTCSGCQRVVREDMTHAGTCQTPEAITQREENACYVDSTSDDRRCVSCGNPIPSDKRADAKKCRSNCDASERQRRSYHKNQYRHQENWRKYSYTERGTVTCLLNYARDRATRFDLPFELDREWLEQKLKAGVCEFSGVDIVREPPKWSRMHPYGPSLDRIKPSLGYTKENTRLVCFAINRAKSDWDDDVLIKLAHGIVDNRVSQVACFLAADSPP